MALSYVNRNKFTPTELRIFELLSDGQPHSGKELLLAIDSQADKVNLKGHLNAIRHRIVEDDLQILHKANGRRLDYILCPVLKVSTRPDI